MKFKYKHTTYSLFLFTTTLFISQSTFAADSVTFNEDGYLELTITAPSTTSLRNISTIDTDTPHYSTSTRLEDFSEYIPGVFTGRASAGTTSDISIRGFSIGGRTYKDGLLDNQRLFIRDPATVERTEIIKGHESVLFGSGSPGGTVNFITKKPQAEAINQLTVAVGSPELYRLSHDIGGTFKTNDQFQYRLVTVAQEAKTGIDNVDDNRITLMPMLSWKNAKTQIDLTAEYSKRERPFDFDSVLQNGEPVYDVSYVDPRNISKRHNRLFDIDIKHQINNHLQAHIQGSNTNVDRKERLIGFYYKKNEDDLVGYYREVDNDYKQFSIKTEIIGDYKLGETKHRPILGFEKNHSDGITDSRRSIGAFTLNINNPQFDFALPVGTQLTENDYRTVSKDHAIYALDTMQINENWLIKAGLRKSWFSETITKTDLYEPQSDSDAISNSFGVSWKASPQLALYGNHSTSFTPNFPDRKQNIFPPKKAKQIEVGLRYRPDNHLWSLDMASYEITQSKLAIRDPDDRDLKILSGEQQVKGLEIKAHGKLGEQLKLSIGYSYMDGTITKDKTGLQGNTINNIPKHSGSLNLAYKINTGFAKKAQLNLGIVGVGKRQGDRANSFKVDGYARADVSAKYPIGKQSALRFSVKNLFDKDYVAASYSEDTLVLNYPRRVILSLEHSW